MNTFLEPRAEGERPAADAPDQPSRVTSHFELSERVLAIALALSLWFAFGSLVLAIAEGLGDQPLRRVLIGLALVVCIGTALWKCQEVAAVLRARPWLVVPIAAAELGLVTADGLIGSPYAAVTVTSLGLAAIVADARYVWLCVAILDGGYAATVLAESSPAQLARDGDLAGVLGAMLGYPFAALVVLGLAGLFRRFVADIEGIVHALRHGAPALTATLTRAVQIGPGLSPSALPAPSPFAELTNREIGIVEALAAGRRPKQVAFAWGVSIATVRAHIKHAKRKTGAATLPELAAMTTYPDWPGTGGQ